MTATGSQTLAFRSRSNVTLTTAGVSIGFGITIFCPNATFTLADNLTLTNTSGLTFAGGPGASTFDANNKNLTLDSFGSSNGNSRTLTMGSGTWELTGTGTVWTTAVTTNLTLNANTSTLVVSNTSATAKTITTGTITLNNVTISGDNITWTGGTTVSTLAVNNAGSTNGLLMGTGTKTVSAFTTNGSVGNLAKLLSSTGGTARTISKSSGIVSVNYMSIQDSTATGGADWYAGANSTDVSGNSGWIFSAGPAVISVNDTMTVSESIDVLRNSARDLSVSDAIALTESNIFQLITNINVSDSTNLSEFIDVMRANSRDLNISDSITLAEALSVLFAPFEINKSESITISEAISVATVFSIILSESVIISESLEVFRDQWGGITEPTTTFDELSEPSTSFSETAEPTSSWTGQTEPADSWTAPSEPDNTWTEITDPSHV